LLPLCQPVVGPLKGGETKSFFVQLANDEFAQFRVEQRGAVIWARLLDPQEKELILLDSPAGGYGPIYLPVIASESGKYTLEIHSFNKWANVYDYEVTLTSLRSATPSDASLIMAVALFADGRKEFRAGQASKAVVAYNGSLAYWSSIREYHWQAITTYALSEAFRSAGDLKQSEEMLDETLNIVKQEIPRNDWRIKASALNDLGFIYGSSGRIDESEAVLNQALDLYGANNDRRGQASSLSNLALTYRRTGNLSLARQLIERALVFRREENDKPGAANLINILGGISDRLGEPEVALNYFQQALNAWEEIGQTRPGDRLNAAAVLSNIGTASDKLGKWDDALEYYDKALAKYSTEDSFRAATLDNKGELFAALGNPVKARECYDQALTILEKTGKPDVDIKAGVLVHIGQLSMQAGDASTAIKWFEQARDLPPSPPRLADVLTNLGAALSTSGHSEKAQAVFRATIEIQTKLKDQRGQALTLQKRGEAYVLQGKREDGLKDFKVALPLWQAVKDQRGEAATLNNIARVERSRGNLLEALAYNDKAIRIVESLRTKVSSRQLRTSYFATQENYYELDVDLKMQLSKTENGRDYVAAALEANEKARARVLLEALNEAGVERSVTTETSDPRFSSMIEQRLKLLSTMAAKAQARTRFLSSPHSPAQIAILDRELRELADKYDELEAKIRARNPKFAKLAKPEPATLRQIQEQLDEDTCFIEYSLGEPRSYAWVVTRDSIDGFELEARSEIEAYANRLKEALSARGRDEKNETRPQKLDRVQKAERDYEEAASLLSKTVLAPVAAKLTKKRLLIIADGALQLLPFAALPDPNAVATTTTPTRLMIQSHELISLPSASVLVLQRKDLADRKPAPNLVAVIADPVFGENDIRAINARRGKKTRSLSQPPADLPQKNGATRETSSMSESSRLTRALEDLGMNSTGEIRRLPYAGREALAILKVAPPNQSFSAIGFKANRAALMNPRLAQYRIVHLATHGIVDLKNPELSGMLLSMLDEKGKEQNGYIGLSEIYNLKLPADLVVLSACETGTGKQIRGEGIIALTRGFMYAGAERLVASLWRVDDQATAELMAIFYEEMLVHKLKPAAALREAQRKLSEQPKWKNPHFWAAFVIQGEWR
jgi:CHAT domain-containing protein/Tfp pilus assembly protein PilF